MPLLLALPCFVLLCHRCACSLLDARVPAALISQKWWRNGRNRCQKMCSQCQLKMGHCWTSCTSVTSVEESMLQRVPLWCCLAASRPSRVKKVSRCCSRWSPASSRSPGLCKLRCLVAINSLEVWRCEPVSANACSSDVREEGDEPLGFSTGTQFSWILNRGFA